MSVVIEPRKKTCGMWRRRSRGPCGVCANCANREWNKTWRSLGPEWQAWVVAQFLMTMRWADETVSPWQAEFRAGPSMTEYVLR